MTIKGVNCWIWPGVPNSDGYAQMRIGGKKKKLHRVMYELFVGKIPKGITIDHLCRNRLCINPDHLEAVTLKTNILRGVGPTAINAKKSCCPRGHQYEQAKRKRLERLCKICTNERRKIWMRKWRKKQNG